MGHTNGLPLAKESKQDAEPIKKATPLKDPEIAGKEGETIRERQRF